MVGDLLGDAEADLVPVGAVVEEVFGEVEEGGGLAFAHGFDASGHC